MSVTIRASEERGRTRDGWLDARHSFSFGDYRDPAHMGFRALRVINEDRVAPGGGFDPHPHRDMEIVTYILSGGLRHSDDTGGAGVLRAGDAQAMSAGSGVVHSEFNASKTEPTHLLQTWIRPAKKATPPRYADLPAPKSPAPGVRVLASGLGDDGALPIGQDARISEVRLRRGGSATHALGPGRGAWVQIARGGGRVNGQAVNAGDGAAVEDEPHVTIEAEEDLLALLFDLA